MRCWVSVNLSTALAGSLSVCLSLCLTVWVCVVAVAVAVAASPVYLNDVVQSSRTYTGCNTAVNVCC